MKGSQAELPSPGRLSLDCFTNRAAKAVPPAVLPSPPPPLSSSSFSFPPVPSSLGVCTGRL